MIGEIVAFIGTGITVIAFIYAFLRNFKNDVNGRIDKLERHMDLMDDRMFQLLTGKSLEQAIKEERMKRNEEVI